MLRTQSSYRQASFFDGLIDSALASNPLLSKVDSILNEMPDLLIPFVTAYGSDRVKRGVDDSFGRPTIPIESVIRSILIKHLHKNCAFRDVEERLKTDYAWKGFSKLSLTDPVPDHTALNKWELFFGERSIRKLHNQIIEYCTEKRIIKGKNFRTDTTVAPANIHYPTDSGLLADAVRVITRTIEKMTAVTKVKRYFRSKARDVKDKMREIGNSLKKRTGEAKQTVMAITREIMKTVERVVERANSMKDQLHTTGTSMGLATQETLNHFIGIAQTLIKQTRKALDGTKIKNRIVSIFQPSMRPIVKGKLFPPCEFGRKMQVDEVENNIVSDWKIFTRNVPDTDVVVPAVDRHRKRFDHDPTLVATDRGCDSQENQQTLKSRVKYVSIPHRGFKTKQRLRTEKSHWFREAQDWRAGGEATISVLKRTSSVGQNRAKTEFGYLQGIAWGIVGRNLRTIATLTG